MSKAVRKSKSIKPDNFAKRRNKQKPPAQTSRRECGWCGKPHQCEEK